jgi:VanZ family protein
MLAYVPLGLFAALVPRRASPRRRIALATVTGLVLSFGLETLQWFLPPRVASLVDWCANGIGAALGGCAGAALARSQPTKRWIRDLRARACLPGTIGDVGIALLAAWLAAQANPAIPLFAVSFDPAHAGGSLLAKSPPELVATLIEALESALQLLGVGLFVALLVRRRQHAAAGAVALIVAALALKGVTALLVFRPAALESWLNSGAAWGVAGGALALSAAIWLPRPALVAVCAVALLSSVMTSLLVPELLFARAPLTLFDWRYGHLLTFNGLTHTLLVVWPVAAFAWLFALAGRPAWGRPPDPLQ